jgi:hypothetical protein
VISARARDTAGNTTLSAEVHVVIDAQAPTGSVTINNGAEVTNSRTVTLTLTAADNAGPITQMRFSNTGSSYSSAQNYSPAKTWTLSSGSGTKTVYAKVKDAAGNWSAPFTDTIELDLTAPTISNVAVTNLTSNSATITWTTNEPATTQLRFGTTSSLGQTTPLDSSLTTVHSVTLAGLSAKKRYYYRAVSKDAAGNQRVGSINSFVTP